MKNMKKRGNENHLSYESDAVKDEKEEEKKMQHDRHAKTRIDF